MGNLRTRTIALALVSVGALLINAAPASAAVITPPTVQFSLTRGDGANWSNNTAGTGSGPDYFYEHHVDTTTWDFDWTVSADPDPILTSSLAITNNTLAIQTFTSTIVLPITNITPSSLRGGSVGGAVTDGNGGGATLATSAGIALYSAQVNGVTEHTLRNDPFSVTASNLSTATFTAVDFGAPIPSTVGGSALNNIAIQIRFTLTPGDSAVVSSSFVVEPVPEPTGLIAIGLLGAMTLLARRRG